jgi:hypothetical protein
VSHERFELDVRLQGIAPPIWRTVEVPGAWSLEDVHYALQVAMGWTNSHLHQFVIGKTSYGMVDVDGAEDVEDERDHRLQDLVGHGESFVYEYDFGDGWEHEVTVNKVSTVAKPPQPRCVAGERACPPEDCGGTSGYERLLEVLADPAHEAYEATRTWSNDFQPESFTLPKNGLDLRDEIEALKLLGEGDDGAEGDDAMFVLPEALIETVLALDPMKRASLGALIFTSLANELVETRQAVSQLVVETKKRDSRRAARMHRKPKRP